MIIHTHRSYKIMEKNLFLTGLSGCGKTTLLRNIIADKLSFAGGFVTERISDPRGKVIGYDLFPAAAASGIPGFTGHRFLDYSSPTPSTDNEVFRIEGTRLLQEAEMYPFAMLDEFGGFELIIPQFREALLDLLNSNTPCIGVLKAAPNAAHLRAKLGLGERYTAYRDALEAALKRDADTIIVPVKGHNDKKAEKLVRAWCEEYLR